MADRLAFFFCLALRDLRRACEAFSPGVSRDLPDSSEGSFDPFLEVDASLDLSRKERDECSGEATPEAGVDLSRAFRIS